MLKNKKAPAEEDGSERIGLTEERLLRLLEELRHLREQVTSLQGRGTELLQENRALRAEVEDRWALLRLTSPSGKATFACKCCGRLSITPDKKCPPYQRSQYGVDQVDCVDWKYIPTRRAL